MIKKVIKFGFLLGVVLLFFLVLLSFYINKKTSKLIYSNLTAVPNTYTGLVLGAKVYSDGTLSGILKDRVDTALELYKLEKIKRFLLSGDHGRNDYDEVNQMKKYLLNNGVPASDIFLDHAGFDTYSSIYRAKRIFLVDSLIIITQKFHVKRAVYIASKLGLSAYGVTADKHSYGIAKRMFFREKVANVKAFLEIVMAKKPKYLGDEIPITGNSKRSYD